MLPKISVLIPLFNANAFIDDCIQSVLGQSYPNIEIIVVDDGSTDNSLAIAKKYLSDNLKVYSQENSGACAARNFGFEKSAGDFIQYLDADDMLHQEKIKNQVQAINSQNPATLLSGRWSKLKDKSEIPNLLFPKRGIDKSYSDPIDWLIDSWNGGGSGQTAIWLSPRSLIQKAGPWMEDLTLNQDGEFFGRVISQSKRIQHVPEAKVYYRTGNKESVSNKNSSWTKASSLLNSYGSYMNILNVRDDMEVRKALSSNYSNFIYQYYPQFPDLLAVARQKVSELGISTINPITGSYFRVISSIFGIETTLKLRALFK